jgi:hypothetical protein
MSNDNVDYHSKYLKYKKKYLDLKVELEDDQEGGLGQTKRQKAASKLYKAEMKAASIKIPMIGGVCLVKQDDFDKIKDTKISEAKATKELEAYKKEVGDAFEDMTFAELREKEKLCATMDKVAMAASSVKMAAASAGMAAASAASKAGMAASSAGMAVVSAAKMATSPKSKSPEKEMA